MSLEKHLKTTYIVKVDDKKPSLPVIQTETSVEDILIKPVNKEEEKELYQTIYSRLYSFIKQDTDYGKLAEALDLNRRRLRQALLFRVGSGEVMQLFGSKKGKCFVCEKRLAFDTTNEPFCLKCLQKVDHYFSEEQKKATTNKPTAQKIGDANEPAPSLETDILQEKEQAEVNEIEAILLMSEEEINNAGDENEIDENIQQLIQKSMNEPLRHYGFKRAKQT